MALLREARSLSRRADKLSGTAAAVDDLTTQQLAAEACTSMEQLVHHLMLLERQVQRGEKAAGVGGHQARPKRPVVGSVL